MLKIEEGKFYETCGMGVVGPMRRTGGLGYADEWVWAADDCKRSRNFDKREVWREDGTWSLTVGGKSDWDLVAEAEEYAPAPTSSAAESIPDDILTTTFAPLEELQPQQKSEAALRYDGGKSRISLIPPEFIEALGRHYGIGAQKYAERNWEKGMSWSRCYDSAQRHMLAFWSGEELDEETGTPHVIAAAWNMAALHWYSLHGQGTDDRPK